MRQEFWKGRGKRAEMMGKRGQGLAKGLVWDLLPGKSWPLCCPLSTWPWRLAATLEPGPRPLPRPARPAPSPCTPGGNALSAGPRLGHAPSALGRTGWRGSREGTNGHLTARLTGHGWASGLGPGRSRTTARNTGHRKCPSSTRKLAGQLTITGWEVGLDRGADSGTLRT